MPSRSEEKKPKKFCSLLTYIEHTNRELYDVAHDLCANGVFSARGGKSVTFLMPKEGSPFHNKIMKEAYGTDPSKAVSIMRACVITQHFNDDNGVPCIEKFVGFGDECQNSLDQILSISKSESTKDTVTLKNSDDTTIVVSRDKNFLPLYDNSRFSVFLIDSGEISINNKEVEKGDSDSNRENKKKRSVEGGAPKLSDDHKYPEDKKVFIRNILQFDLAKRMTAGSSPASFLKDTSADTFTAMAVSYMRYLKENKPVVYNDTQKCLNVNPMCICTIIIHVSNDEEYKGWTKTEDTNTSYNYGDYKSHLPPGGGKDDINSFLNDVKNNINTQANRNKIYTDVLEKYRNKYGKLAMTMLVHHESLLVADLYLKAVKEKNSTLAQDYMNIYLTHYCIPNAVPVLISESALCDNLVHQSVLCKAYEFIFSDIFLGGTSQTKRKVIDSDNVTPINMLTDLAYIDFTKPIVNLFSPK